MIMNAKRQKGIVGRYSQSWKNMIQLEVYDFDVVPPNQRFQPTASLATLASRRLNRMPLGRMEDTDAEV